LSSPVNVADLPDITFYVAGCGCSTLELRKAGRSIAARRAQLRQIAPLGGRIGLMFPSSPELVLYWLAAVAAGLTPLILQYPTRKMSREYWSRSLVDAVGAADLSIIVHDSAIDIGDIEGAVIHCFSGEPPITEKECCVIAGNPVLQMSSGTTGNRKPIGFTWEQLKTHVCAYNQIMQMTPADCVVSWLPLYHDMGFIAAFAMPLLLGVPMVMIDPIVWVQERELLFKAIREQRSTICYMPNFGFEVMSRIPRGPHALDSMRLWISSSEPVYKETLERFAAATRTPLAKMRACYAMAENVFAVSQSEGIATTTHNGAELVSCGRPLPGTDVKVVDGQIFVRSPVSLRSYLSGETIVDEEGFYPTGDMGILDRGELFIAGRVHDILLQAGQKFFLSDFDFIVNEVDPTCRGRAASLALRDEYLRTEKLVILIEREDFLDEAALADLQARLAKRLPTEIFELYFVPTGFITKTSSGKINRKATTADFRRWQDGRAERSKALERTPPLEDALATFFPFADRKVPLGEALDSLGLVLARLLADEHGLVFDISKSLDEFATRVPPSRGAATVAEHRGITLVSCMDGSAHAFSPTPEDLLDISRHLGIQVSFERICLPPAYFLWQDIVFRDYFMPRNPSPAYRSYLSVLDRLDQASVLLFDCGNEIGLQDCSFPILDRRFKRTAVADLLCFRYQRFAQQHHQLPVGRLMLGSAVTKEQRQQAFTNIVRYFGIPLFRVCSHPLLAFLTEDWEYYDLSGRSIEPMRTDFVAALKDFLSAKLGRLPRRELKLGSDRPGYEDMAHFCSFVVDPALVNAVVQYFDAFVILGLPNAMP